MGKVVKKVTGALGLTADENAGAGQLNRANALQARAVRELEKLDIPTIEAQKIVLQNPELILSSADEQLTGTAFDDIQTDSRLREAELDNLAALQQAGEEGFTAEDKARQEALFGRIARDEQARQASILQQMAQRGAMDSGAQLAAQLGSSQDAAQRASEQAVQMAGQQAAARRNALAQAASTAGQMQGRDYREQAQQAQARDAIQRFNASVAARDTGARQQNEAQRVATANQQEMYNQGLIQQQFQNQLAKATGVTSALGNQAQQAMQAGAMQANAAQQAAAGMRGLALGGAKAAMMSDERVKEDISTPSSDNIQEMLDKLSPKEYKYKDPRHGEGKQIGVMAQDLEKSSEGDKYVMETPEGKAVDYGKMGGALAAGLSDVHQRLKKLEGDEYAAGGIAGLEGLLAKAAMSSEGEAEPKEETTQDKLLKGLKNFSEGYKEGAGEPIKPFQVGDINPNRMDQIAATAGQGNPLARIRQEIMQQGMAAANGGIKDPYEQLMNSYADGGMNYQSGGMGAIIDSGEESFTGDDLPDRINDGEMVLNLDQQDHIEDLLKELAMRRRNDEMVDEGSAEINPMQQETLMAIARGEAEPEDLMLDADIVEMPLDELSDLLNDFDAYANGGIEGMPDLGAIASGPLDLDNITDSLANLGMPEEEPMMTPAEPDFSQMMSVGEPAPLPETEPEVVEEVKDTVDKKQVEKANETVESKNVPKKEDTELKEAQRKDVIFNLMDDIDAALAHFDAANPNAMLKPIQKKRIKAEFEKKLREARALAANQDYKKRQLDIQEAGQKAAADERKLKREERQAKVQTDQSRKQKDQDRRFASDIYKVRKDFLADPVVKELRKQDVSFDQAEGLLEAMRNDNKVAVGALGTKMARAMGEVGVLTDADVIRYIRRMDVSGRVQDYFSRNFKGKVSDMTQKDLEDITEIMRMGATKRINRLREDYVDAAYDNFGKQYGMERDEVSKRIGARGSKGKQTKEDLSGGEIRRKTKDGRIAIFDENKKFLRYEE